MKRSTASNLLRKFRLLFLTDKLRFHIHRFKFREENRRFKKEHPEFRFPPDYLMYESFEVDYKKYFEDGYEGAQWLARLISKYTPLENINILDWGCGPGRIIRHLPGLTGTNCSFYGTDYNARSIQWCSKNLKGIHFNTNNLQAELPFPDSFFGVIYGLSIFTHLSEEMHHQWLREHTRILKPGGLMLFTTQGKNFLSKLSLKEQDEFINGRIVVRGNVKEGHRVFSAFQPNLFMEKLFSGLVIEEHIEPIPESEKPPQDVWIVRKK